MSKLAKNLPFFSKIGNFFIEKITIFVNNKRQVLVNFFHIQKAILQRSGGEITCKYKNTERLVDFNVTAQTVGGGARHVVKTCAVWCQVKTTGVSVVACADDLCRVSCRHGYGDIHTRIDLCH